MNDTKNEQASVSLIGHIRIRDKDTGETILRQRDLDCITPPARALDATYHEPIPATPQEYWRSLVEDYAAHLRYAHERLRTLPEKPSQDD